jgi:hypothetical protein
MKLSLQEYSEKLIKDIIAKFKDDASERVVRNLITNFDRIKDGLATKKGVVIPDRLKNNNLFKDITQYTFDELNTLIKSLPVDEKKLKAAAIDYYVQKDRIDKGIATHYVNRYFKAKSELKALVKSSDKEERERALQLIPKDIQQKDMYTNINNWKDFEELERMLDALFPLKGSDEKDETNTADINADKIFSRDNIEVYIGDEQHKCISYGKGDYYKWCIVRTGTSNMYYNYRFSQSGENRMFYFVIDRNRTDKKTSPTKFVDPWHAFVIHIGEQGSYWVSDADNDFDKKASSWDGLGKYIPSDIWSKIKDLKDNAKFIPPTKGEILTQALKGKRLSVNDFNQLDYEEKKAYITTNSQSGLVTSEIFETLDNELKNQAINSGRKCTYNELKDSPALAKRYAVVRMRHETYSKEPIPLPFIKYLDPKGKNSQEEYLNKFNEDYLDYDVIDKYFDKEITKEYVKDKVSKLDYLPKEAKKYMDNKEKALYDTYSIPFTDTSLKLVNDDTIDSQYDVPVREGEVHSISNESFKDIDTKSRGEYIKMLKTLMKDSDNVKKYSTLFLGIPITFNINDTLYFFAPFDKNIKVNATNKEFCFYNEQGTPKIRGLRSNILLQKDGKQLPKDKMQGYIGSNTAYITENDFDTVILTDRDGEVKRLNKDTFIKMLTK